MVSEFHFSEPENLAVFVCENVLGRGKPVLHVSRDEEGDWQFLCGGYHADEDDDAVSVVCLRDVVERDSTLNQVATLCMLGDAEREQIGAPWRVHDRMEDRVNENVREYGCHVMRIDTDDEGPGFVYSIGLTKNFGQPELICFGLDAEVMHWLINEMRDRMAKGECFADGDRVSDLLEGYACVLKTMRKRWYREFLGCALWFHDGEDFDALQVVWPDKQHRYPWDGDYAAPMGRQPRTWQDELSA
jgi:hypothetical protein